MKMLFLAIVVLTSANSMRAADPEGFDLWKGTMVKNSGKELTSKIDEQKFAWLPLATYQNHLMGISHREGDGSAELHETQVDILIVEGGEATLVVGGTMIAPKTIKPHEVRGTSIEGGEIKQLTPRRCCAHPGQSAASVENCKRQDIHLPGNKSGFQLDRPCCSRVRPRDVAWLRLSFGRRRQDEGFRLTRRSFPRRVPRLRGV